ncbi:MAG: MurR/RpiR family transcriptional regulator [bacterium]|nr:MurR/RpiR family transcriptional regulator [bacterium]
MHIEKTLNKTDSMPEELDFMKAIKAKLDQFTPTQNLLADYILQNPEAVLFMTIVELAKAAQVSEASIVRFCSLIGYSGYTQLTKKAQQLIHSQMSTAGRFELARDRLQTTPRAKHNQYRPEFPRILAHEMENLNRLAESIKIDDFNRTIELLIQADRIVIVGCLASASLAEHFGYMLSKILPQVDVIRSESHTSSAKIMRLSSKSVAFLVSFPRYPAQTLRLGEQVAATDARIVSITDSHLSPISRLGEIMYHIHVGIPGYVDAYAAPLTFINALCTELAERYPEQAVECLDRYDRFAEKADLFYKRTHIGRPKNSPLLDTKRGGMKSRI